MLTYELSLAVVTTQITNQNPELMKSVEKQRPIPKSQTHQKSYLFTRSLFVDMKEE